MVAQLFFSVLILGSAVGRAALPTSPNVPRPMKVLSDQGALIGGAATGSPMTIKDVRLVKVGVRERLIVDVTDVKGAPIKGPPGYYHVELKRKPSKQLVIDFAQTTGSFMNEAALKERLKTSQKIVSSRLMVDPYDQSVVLVLDLKEAAQVQVFQVPGKKATGRVVVDLL